MQPLSRKTAVIALMFGFVAAIGFSYATQKPDVPPELENISASKEPAKDAELMYVALENGRTLDTFKLALSLNPHTTNGNSNMLTAMAYATGVLDLYREDHCKAAVWYDHAARFRQVMPAVYMSIIYAHGQGVKRDPEAAYFWYLQARRLANTYPVGQWPDLDWSRYISGLELSLEAHLPEVRDSVSREKLDEKLKDRKVEEQPLAIPQPVPDIPFFAQIFGQLFYDSTGCRGPENNGFGWFNSQYRAEQLLFKPTPRAHINGIAGLAVQF